MCALVGGERLFLLLSVSARGCEGSSERWAVSARLHVNTTLQVSVMLLVVEISFHVTFQDTKNGPVEGRIPQLSPCGGWTPFTQKPQNSKAITSSILIWKDPSSRRCCLICGGATLIANFSRWRLCMVTSLPCTSAWDECQFVWFNFSINDKAPFMASTERWMN